MKPFVSPFLWYLLVQCVVLVILQRRMTGRIRLWIQVLLMVMFVLAAASTPLMRRGLEASLFPKSVSDSLLAPAFILVLGGGYLHGGRPDEDVLGDESQQRVLHGVNVWRRFPDARLVFSGASPDDAGLRDSGREVQLMAQVAIAQGVPASAVLLEPYSRNTREHPVQALKLPGITPATPISVVTSSWHTRRAQQEFCRYFQHLRIDPVPHNQALLIDWSDFLPGAGTLDFNTTLLREWVGMAWYAVLDARKGPPRQCPSGA